MRHVSLRHLTLNQEKGEDSGTDQCGNTISFLHSELPFYSTAARKLLPSRPRLETRRFIFQPRESITG